MDCALVNTRCSLPSGRPMQTSAQSWRHDWADVCIGRPDGSEHRVLTSAQSMWFAAAYGNQQTRGGGSNLPAWTRDGAILFPRRTSAAKVAWQYRVGKPDV